MCKMVQAINKGLREDRGMIRVYYEDMKLSPEVIAKKMNKPLEEVQEIIQNLSDESYIIYAYKTADTVISTCCLLCNK